MRDAVHPLRRLRGWITGRPILLATTVAAALLGAAGVAYATIPDSSGVIHTCYSKSRATWRPIDHPTEQCKSNEESLSWNQAGPPGTPGPSDAYFDSALTDPGGADTTMVSLDLPDGDYTLVAKTHVYNAIENSFAICRLEADGDVLDEEILRLIAPANDQVVSFVGVVSFAEPGTVSLVCNGNGVESVEADESYLLATKVGALHQSS
jgi:hypothetical protein